VQNENIIISITAYDIFFKKTIISITENGDTGLNIFNLINVNIGQNLAEKMSRETTMIDEITLAELQSKNMYKIEETDKTIIQKLLEEKQRYLKYDINLRGSNFSLAIPRGYNVIIFVRDDPGVFKIKYNDQIYESAANGIKIMVFENGIGAKKDFYIINGQTIEESYKYIQKKDSEIVVKNVKFKNDNIKFTLLKNEKNYLLSSSVFMGMSSFFLISGGITTGVMGYFIYLYYNTDIEKPEDIIKYKDIVYTLFPVSLALFSVTGVFLIPALVLIGIFSYCNYLKKREFKNSISFELNFLDNNMGFLFKIKL
ncbi:MAG TPA: hypothetical protein PK771_15365, partial [Spirochaetota bacterium]|nr:hypothetical protein [Spirochaetota bacterium]